MSEASSTSAGWDKTAEDYDKYVSITGDYAQKIIELFMSDNSLQKRSESSEKFDILDVAAGTGAATIKLIEHFGNKARYVATDIAGGMLKFLEHKAKNYDVSVTTKVQDGQNLNEIASNSMDFLFCLFGIIFFPDRAKGFAEMYRVLRPGGSAFVSSWLTTDTMTITLELAKRFDNEEAIKKSMARPFELQDKERFKKEMEAAGFEVVKIETISLTSVMPREGMISMSKTNPALALFDLNKIESELNAYFDEKYGPDAQDIPLNFVSHLAYGKKPNAH